MRGEGRTCKERKNEVRVESFGKGKGGLRGLVFFLQYKIFLMSETKKLY